MPTRSFTLLDLGHGTVVKLYRTSLNLPIDEVLLMKPARMIGKSFVPATSFSIKGAAGIATLLEALKVEDGKTKLPTSFCSCCQQNPCMFESAKALEDEK